MDICQNATIPASEYSSGFKSLLLTQNKPEYTYSYTFEFEATYDAQPLTNFLQKYYWTFVVPLSALYLLFVKHVPKYIHSQNALKLEFPLLMWNTLLAVFSIIGTVRVMPEVSYQFQKNGFEHSVCSPGFAHNKPSAFWAELFIWSKFFELIDTAFLVLRGKPVIFLHWYHHTTVLLYTAHASREHAAPGRWFVAVNFSIHAAMYSYFALRSLLSYTGRSLKIPKAIPMAITFAQIAQMFLGLLICGTVWRIKLSESNVLGDVLGSSYRLQGGCQQTYGNLMFASLIYGSYALLFVQFFYKAYFSSRLQQRKTDAPANNKQKGA